MLAASMMHQTPVKLPFECKDLSQLKCLGELLHADTFGHNKSGIAYQSIGYMNGAPDFGALTLRLGESALPLWVARLGGAN
jgi:hypothetical protein